MFSGLSDADRMLYNQFMTDPRFFKELHSFEDADQSLVINEITGDVGVLKKLSHYSEEVYDELSKLKSCHIPKIYCHGRFEDYAGGGYIVIEEHISGTTLEDYLLNNKPSFKERMRIFNEIADGLIELHGLRKPVIHRDIKMSNIMITSQGNVVIVDFDAAKIADPKQSRDTTLIGTEGYAAPEQYGFGPSDQRTDIYAFGKLVEKMFPDSPKMQKIAGHATNMDPKHRFQTVKAMKNYNVDLKHSILPPPGFRTGNIGKAVFSLVVYAYFIYFVITFGAPDTTPLFNIIYKILLVMIFLIELDLFCDWVHIFSKLPFVLHHKLPVRILAKIVWGVLLAFTVTIVFLISMVQLIYPFTDGN